ncbi:hypothetical protein CFP56_036324 [Quercus suber]|uniref:Uncharacterized protein n=1 Tax=Quercus suber TaxID=58331 RepID=A0AAW0J824_QUESU
MHTPRHVTHRNAVTQLALLQQVIHHSLPLKLRHLSSIAVIQRSDNLMWEQRTRRDCCLTMLHAFEVLLESLLVVFQKEFLVILHCHQRENPFCNALAYQQRLVVGRVNRRAPFRCKTDISILSFIQSLHISLQHLSKNIGNCIVQEPINRISVIPLESFLGHGQDPFFPHRPCVLSFEIDFSDILLNPQLLGQL